MATRSSTTHEATKGRETTGMETKGEEGTDPDAQRSLRTALRMNAGFSGASGAAIVGFSGVLADVMGAGTRTLYLVIGVLLVAYAVGLAFLAGRGRIPRWEGVLVVAGDWAWVVGSAVVIGLGLLSTFGAAVVAAAAAAVGGFAVWQGRSLPAD